MTKEEAAKANAPVTKLTEPKPSEQSMFFAIPGGLWVTQPSGVG
jgi:hypothetical protein